MPFYVSNIPIHRRKEPEVAAMGKVWQLAECSCTHVEKALCHLTERF